MEKLPEKSEASTSNGIWFVWNDGTNTIRIWGSAMSGKEKIYLNDTLISEKKNLKINSEHVFEDTNKNIYGVKIHAQSVFSGTLECQFTKNGVVRKKNVCKFKTGKMFNMKNIGIFLAGFLILFILTYLLKLTETIVFMLMIVLLVFVFRMNRKKQYIIEEIDVDRSAGQH